MGLFSAIGATSLTRLRSIDLLCLTGLVTTVVPFLEFASQRPIERLSLKLQENKARFNEEAVRLLATLASLTELDLSASTKREYELTPCVLISVAAIDGMLQPWPKLRKLSIDAEMSTEQYCAFIRSAPSLAHLTLRGWKKSKAKPITALLVAAIAAYCPQICTLTIDGSLSTITLQELIKEFSRHDPLLIASSFKQLHKIQLVRTEFAVL